MSEPQQGPSESSGAPGQEPTPAPPTGWGPAAPSSPTGWGPAAPGGAPGYGGPQQGPPAYGTPPQAPPPQGQPPQYGTPQYGAPQYGAPQYGTPQYGAPQYGVGQYGAPQYGGAPAGYRPSPLQRGVVPLRPLSLGEIFDGAFRSVRSNPRVMFGFAALVVGVATLFGALTQFLLIPLISGWFTGVTDEIDPAGTAGLADSFAFSFSSLGFTPWLLLAQAVLTGLLTASVSRSVIGQTATVGELWRRHRRQVAVLVGLGLAYMLAGLLVTAGVVALVVLLFVNGQEGLGVVAALVAGLALVVGSVWISVRVLLVPPALVLEGEKTTSAIVRGWKLSRGSFWRLLGIYLLAQLVVGVVGQVVLTPITMIAMFAFEEMTSAGAIAVLAVGQGIVYALTIVFTSAVVALLYIDVRMRREGLDVELARAAESAAVQAAA